MEMYINCLKWCLDCYKTLQVLVVATFCGTPVVLCGPQQLTTVTAGTPVFAPLEAQEVCLSLTSQAFSSLAMLPP